MKNIINIHRAATILTALCLALFLPRTAHAASGPGEDFSGALSAKIIRMNPSDGPYTAIGPSVEFRWFLPTSPTGTNGFTLGINASTLIPVSKAGYPDAYFGLKQAFSIGLGRCAVMPFIDEYYLTSYHTNAFCMDAGAEFRIRLTSFISIYAQGFVQAGTLTFMGDRHKPDWGGALGIALTLNKRR